MESMESIQTLVGFFSLCMFLEKSEEFFDDIESDTIGEKYLIFATSKHHRA
jgi:hypothetical protein